MSSRTDSELHPDPAVARWIRRDLAAHPLRAPSLIITVWGDAIAPHRGAAMLPGLIALLEPLGINERLVRTSVFRLAREGWLAAKAVGRRSLYRLTRDGARRFEQAYRRIYTPPVERWDDTWEIVLAYDATAAQRRALQMELSWEGFAALGPGAHVRPSAPRSAVPRIVAALGLGERVIVARASDDKAGPAWAEARRASSLAAAVPHAWDLAAFAGDYRRFLTRFGGVIQRFQRTPEEAHHPGQSFAVRTLLIHAYRRVLLRDPRLPAALLPLDWPGPAAYALCRDFYRLTHRAAERHLLATLENERGSLPPASASFYRRFGGLR